MEIIKLDNDTVKIVTTTERVESISELREKLADLQQREADFHATYNAIPIELRDKVIVPMNFDPLEIINLEEKIELYG